MTNGLAYNRVGFHQTAAGRNIAADEAMQFSRWLRCTKSRNHINCFVVNYLSLMYSKFRLPERKRLSIQDYYNPEDILLIYVKVWTLYFYFSYILRTFFIKGA